MELAALATAVDHLEARARDWQDPLDDMGEAVRAEYEARFARSGPGWPRPREGNKPGTKTGALRASFGQRGAPGNVTDIGHTEARFGSSLPYAEEFQQGHLVAREPGRELTREISDRAKDHLAGALEGLL